MNPSPVSSEPSLGLAPQLHVDGAVATITLRRPALANRLSFDDLRVLREHVAHVNGIAEVRVLLLRGQGRHFCAGYDIGDIGSSQHEGAGLAETVDAVEDCRPVSVAVLQGGVFGGGTDLALACDFRVGAPATRMFMPAARLGLHFYESGMRRYVERLGPDNARRMFLLAEELDAAQMREIGFLTHLVSADDELAARVDALTQRLGGMAPIALLGMKQALNALARGTADADAIHARVQQSTQSADLREGGLAWREKRTPRFEGR